MIEKGTAMGIYIGVTVITVALACFINKNAMTESNTVSRQQMCNAVFVNVIFLLLFAVSACRIAVGNDYWVYKQVFFLISQDRYVSTEFGFNLVVRVMQFLFGADNYLVIFGLFSLGTVAFFIKAVNDQSRHFAWSLFLLLTAGYYFSSLNSVRYYFALSIALFAMKYAVKGDWTRFVLWILFASCFHKSVLLVIPVYYLATRSFRRWQLVVVLGICSTFLVFQDFYRKIIFFFYPFYENSAFDAGETSLINVAKCVAVLVLSLLYYNVAIKDSRENRFYFYLNCGAFIIYAFCSFIPEISRVGYYLNISNIFLIPAILGKIPNKKQKIFFSAATAAAFLIYFAVFLKKGYSVDIRILPYLNWIFN